MDFFVSFISQMQSILHHNSSGSRAFAGNLKNREVHNAISLHPIKKAPFMYRLHAYTLGLRAQELRQRKLLLHRDIAYMLELLQVPRSNRLIAPGVPIFPENETNGGVTGTVRHVSDHNLLGKPS